MIAIFQIIAHEYKKYVFTRGFLLLVLIVPAFMAFYVFGQQFSRNSEPVRVFAVLDATARYTDDIDDALERRRQSRAVRAWDSFAEDWVQTNADGSYPLDYPFAPQPGRDEQRRRDFDAAGGIEAAYRAARSSLKDEAPEAPTVPVPYVRVDVPAGIAALDTDQARIEALVPYLRGDKLLDDGRSLFAALVIPDTFGDPSAGEDQDRALYWSTNLLASDLRDFLDSTLTRALRTEAFVAEGVEAVRAAEINTVTADVVPVSPSAAGGDEGAGAVITTIIPLFLAYALFILTTSVGGMMLTNTVEEKSNKIVELLLSSVSASQLMIGKLVGLALVGLTLPVIFFTSGYVLTTLFGVDTAPEGAQAVLSAIEGRLFESGLVPLFLCCFVLGYLFFASIYLGVGAISNSIQDAQSFVVPLTLILLLPLPFLGIVVQDPNGLVARALTWIPVYTPYLVMLRLGGEPPIWEIVGASTLLLLTVGYVLFIMGRVYRNGVLGSSGAPSWKAILNLSK